MIHIFPKIMLLKICINKFSKKNIQNDTLLNHALSVNVQTYNGDNRKRKGSGHVHSDVIGQVTEVGLGD